MWAQRAVSEWKKAAERGGRTWFVTLTFHPAEHYAIQTATRQRLASLGGDLDTLDWDARYGELLHEYHAEIDRFLQRLRVGLATRGWKAARHRYLAVPEPHKGDGIRVHYHLLLHEAPSKSGEIVPLTRRRIEQAWRGELGAAAKQALGSRARRDLGFIQAKLVMSPQAAVYVTKYLGKHHYEGRLRVSTSYGSGDDEDPEQALKRPAVPHPDVEHKRAPQPPVVADSRTMHVAMVECSDDDDATDPVRVGEPLGVCPSGLHIGDGCDCTAVTDVLECWSDEHDELRGTPRRKWPLRGWHQTRRRGGHTEAGGDPVAGEPAGVADDVGGTRH